MKGKTLKAFLTGVDPSTPQSYLSQFLCSHYRGVVSVKKDPNKRHGYVFVHFDEKENL